MKKILQNIAPIIYIPDQKNVQFSFKLYTLKESANLESLHNANSYETLQNYSNNPDNKDNAKKPYASWDPSVQNYLRPESIGVVMISVKLSHFHLTHTRYLRLYIEYDVVYENLKYRQGLKLNAFQISRGILYDPQHQLDDCISSAQNFLTIAHTSFGDVFDIDVASYSEFLDELCKILVDKMQFKRVTEMPSEINLEEGASRTEPLYSEVFYKLNCNGGNYWYGTVLIVWKTCNVNRLRMTIYAPTQSVISSMLHLLDSTFKGKYTMVPEEQTLGKENKTNITQALREEIHSEAIVAREVEENGNAKESAKSSSVVKNQKKLHSQQLKTDVTVVHGKKK